MRYRSRPTVVDAIRLEWGNWNQICDLVGVGSLEEGLPTGVWVDPSDGSTYKSVCPPDHLSIDEAELGLLVPTDGAMRLARQGEWVIKEGDFIFIVGEQAFQRTYEPFAELGEGVRAVTPQVGGAA